MSTQTQTKRRYLTRAKVDALLELAGYGEDYVVSEMDDLVKFGERELEDLEPDELAQYLRHGRTLDLAREAREIIASRGGVRLS